MGAALLTLDEVIDLKEFVDERFGVHLHYHDRCGGQSFQAETMDPQLRAYLTGYFDALSLRTVFSDDGSFVVCP